MLTLWINKLLEAETILLVRIMTQEFNLYSCISCRTVTYGMMLKPLTEESCKRGNDFLQYCTAGDDLF